MGVTNTGFWGVSGEFDVPRMRAEEQVVSQSESDGGANLGYRDAGLSCSEEGVRVPSSSMHDGFSEVTRKLGGLVVAVGGVAVGVG